MVCALAQVPDKQKTRRQVSRRRASFDLFCWLFLQAGRVRRHVRHVMMSMTMMVAALHVWLKP